MLVQNLEPEFIQRRRYSQNQPNRQSSGQKWTVTLSGLSGLC